MADDAVAVGGSEPTTGTATLVSVNRVHALIADPVGSIGRTAIDKRPVPAATIDEFGMHGDTVLDRESHGGADKAVYAYATEDTAYWAGELGREITPGTFGENLTTQGLDVTGAVIGERWQLGDTVTVEVAMPRTPCATFQAWMDVPHWVKRFTEHGATGAYLRVLVGGEVHAGQPITVVHRPAHGVTIGEVFAGRKADPDRLRALLDEPALAEDLVYGVRKALGLDAIVGR